MAAPLGLSVINAAAGIYEVVTARMSDLIRKVTVESGYDPRNFCLFSYGGAGGAHCAVIARQLAIERVIIPYTAPVFSAFGIALSDFLFSYAKSDPMRLEANQECMDTFNRTFAELEERAQEDMRDSGVARHDVHLVHQIEIRYQGQMNEVTLVWAGGRLTADTVSALRHQFETYYQMKYGQGTTRSESPLEVIGFRVQALKPTAKPALAPLADTGWAARVEHAQKAIRPVYMHGQGWLEAAVYDFARWRPGLTIQGPAVVERHDTTVWVAPGCTAGLDPYGNIEIRTGRGCK